MKVVELPVSISFTGTLRVEVPDGTPDPDDEAITRVRSMEGSDLMALMKLVVSSCEENDGELEVGPA